MHLAYGLCTPGNGFDRSGGTLTLYDQPGTVFDIPAGQGQAQAAALKQFCAADNAATCTFTANSEAKVDSPSHQVGDALSNPTDEDQDTRISTQDTVETSDSVGVALKVGAKIAGVVEVSVEAKYEHKSTHGAHVHTGRDGSLPTASQVLDRRRRSNATATRAISR